MNDTPAKQMIAFVLSRYDHEHVSLWLTAIAPDCVELEQIWSEEIRGAGHGSNAMRLVIEAADQFDVTLTLTASRLLYDEAVQGDDFTDLMVELNSRVMDNDQLAAWYAKFGFKETGEYQDETYRAQPLMQRLPGLAITPKM